MAKLSTEDRDDLSKGSFAFPKQRKEPLENASHVRNAGIVDMRDQRCLFSRRDESVSRSEARQGRQDRTGQASTIQRWCRTAQSGSACCTALPDPAEISSTTRDRAGGVTSRSISGTSASSHCITCRRWMIAPCRS